MKTPTLPGFSSDAFQKYFKNTSWLLLARVGSLGIKMLVTAILIPNYLGGELTGALNYPLIFFFTGISTLGTDALVTRELLQKPHLKNEILGSALRLRLYGGLLAIPLILCTYLIIQHISAHTPAASLTQVAIMSLICLVQITQIIDSFFQSQTQGKKIMFVQVGGNILSALIKLLIVIFDGGINALIWMLVIDVLIFQLGYIYFYQKTGSSIFKWKYNKRIARQLLKLGAPLIFSAIFVSIYMRIGQIMIDSFVGNKASGVYSTVLQFTESWYFIGVAICTSLFPAIMNFRKNNTAIYEKRMSNLYDLLTIISVGIASCIAIGTPYFYQWFYGQTRPEFLEAIPALQINVWAGVFAFLGTASGQYLIAEGLTKISFIRTLIGAIAIVIAGLLLIPKYGLIGAAYANVVAQLLSTFSILLFASSRKQGYSILKSLFFINILTLLSKKILKNNA